MILPGRLCKLDHPGCGSYNGELVVFIAKQPFTGSYMFKTFDNTLVTLPNQNQFIVLPTMDEFKDLIDLSLSLGDREWFEELVQAMKLIKGYEVAKGMVRQ
ncbi:hypothetical protein [Robertmurraya sp.]|uniref:hypothetical protein n=1 Tax=Robertmurraya sp. TaxID=2837525 RepID=UPI0037044948